MHSFKKYILKYNSLKLQEWKDVEKCHTRKEYKKGELILENGNIIWEMDKTDAFDL